MSLLLVRLINFKNSMRFSAINTESTLCQFLVVHQVNLERDDCRLRDLHMFLMVTSVTPAASASPFCLMRSSSFVAILARYKTEAANPIGFFPADNTISSLVILLISLIA